MPLTVISRVSFNNKIRRKIINYHQFQLTTIARAVVFKKNLESNSASDDNLSVIEIHDHEIKKIMLY